MTEKKETVPVSKADQEKETTQADASQEYIRYLLKGPYTDVKKMTVAQLRNEVQMWRNVWNWVPSEVRYYVARVGQMCGITQRNYVRHLGVLLDTHWSIDEMELGVYEKQYDLTTGDYFFERKIIKVKPTGLMDIQWIAERERVDDVLAKAEAAAAEQVPPNDTVDNDTEDKAE